MKKNNRGPLGLLLALCMTLLLVTPALAGVTDDRQYRRPQ